MSCTCNKSPNCDPCAFCLPPGVTCLPDCNPKDPCGDDVIDICCVKWAGSDYPCSFIEKGDPLCDIIFKILAKLFPPDRCCYFDIAVTLLSVPTTTIAPTTTIPPTTTTIAPTTTTIPPTTAAPTTSTTTAVPEPLCISFDGGSASAPFTEILEVNGIENGKPIYTFAANGCVKWDTASQTWRVLLDCNDNNTVTSFYAYLDDDTPTPISNTTPWTCVYNPSGFNSNCDKAFGEVSISVGCITSLCVSIAGEAVGLPSLGGAGEGQTITQTGITNNKPSYSFTYGGFPMTIIWSNTNNRWEWTITQPPPKPPLVYILNTTTYVPISGITGWQCIGDIDDCDKTGVAVSQQGPCPDLICAVGKVPCVEPYDGGPPCIEPFSTGIPYIDDSGYIQKINGKYAYTWNFTSGPDVLLVFWTGFRWEARVNATSGTLVGYLLSSTLEGTWTVVTSTGQYIKETSLGQCCNCVIVEYPDSNPRTGTYTTCNGEFAEWTIAEAGTNYAGFCTITNRNIEYPNFGVFGTPIVYTNGECSNYTGCPIKLCFVVDTGEAGKNYVNYTGSITLFGGKPYYTITDIVFNVPTVPIAYVYFNLSANRWEIGANLGNNTVAGGTLYGYITAITPPAYPILGTSVDWTMTSVVQNKWLFITKIPTDPTNPICPPLDGPPIP
jgi:hypothetical protein